MITITAYVTRSAGRRICATVGAHVSRLCASTSWSWSGAATRRSVPISSSSAWPTRGGRVAPPTVYRALEFLSREGLIHRIDSLNAYVGCPSAGSPARQATSSSVVTAARPPRFATTELSSALARCVERAQFQVEAATVEMSGLCARCAREAAKTDEPASLVAAVMPVSSASRPLSGEHTRWTIPAGLRIQNPSRSGGSFSTSSQRTTPVGGEMRGGRLGVGRDQLQPHLTLRQMWHSVDPEPERPELECLGADGVVDGHQAQSVAIEGDGGLEGMLGHLDRYVAPAREGRCRGLRSCPVAIPFLRRPSGRCCAAGHADVRTAAAHTVPGCLSLTANCEVLLDEVAIDQLAIAPISRRVRGPNGSSPPTWPH